MLSGCVCANLSRPVVNKVICAGNSILLLFVYWIMHEGMDFGFTS